MKFGTYFAYWEQEWNVDFTKYCNKVSRLGFDVLEVAASGLVGMSDEQLTQFKENAIRENITLTACIGLPAMYDVSSDNINIRESGISYLKEIIVAMRKVDIKVLGGIIYASWPYDYNIKFDKNKSMGNSISSMREVADFAKEYDVTLMLEVVNRFEHFILNTAKEAVDFVKKIGKENVKILLDCFHMNIEEDSLEEAILLAGKHLGHFHIGEANRKVPGKGHMAWGEIADALNEIGYDGYVVMEPFVKMGGTVGKDIKVWRDLSDNADVDKLDNDIEQALKFIKGVFC